MFNNTFHLSGSISLHFDQMDIGQASKGFFLWIFTKNWERRVYLTIKDEDGFVVIVYLSNLSMNAISKTFEFF